MGESGALASLLADLPGPDPDARDHVAARAATVLRPAGAFARLDAVAAWLAGWQGTAAPRVERPHVVVFAADHGVAAEGVSAYPAEVTAAMAEAIHSGVATISVLAREVGATLELLDVGVGRPTGNIRVADAMSTDEFDEAVAAGAAAVEGADADLLVVGEIGIGNTTAAAAVAAAVLGGEAADWVGPGTGVVGAALAHKCDVVQAALDRVGVVSPLEALRRLGGRELAAMAGAVATARRRRLPVVLDGFIATAAVGPLAVVRPGSLDHCLAGHCSAEPGHQRALETLGLDPLMRLDLRLGEGSGALVAVPIIRMAAAAVTDVATFEEALVLSTLVRVFAVSSLAPVDGLVALVVDHMLGRTMAVALMGVVPATASTGLGHSYAAHRPRAWTAAVVVVTSAAAAALGLVGTVSLATAAAGAVIVWLVARRAFGGTTGDVLGASEQVAEMAVLLSAASLASTHGWSWA